MIRPQVSFHDRRLFLYVITGLVLCAYDAVATMWHIGRGVATEGNPLMQSLIEVNAVVFFFVKMSLTAMGLLICYGLSHLRTARFGLQLAVGIYSILTVYHILIVLFG
ncbi:MAG: DUF5658 family protein [Acidobacteriota bacterium]